MPCDNIAPFYITQLPVHEPITPARQYAFTIKHMLSQGWTLSLVISDTWTN